MIAINLGMRYHFGAWEREIFVFFVNFAHPLVRKQYILVLLLVNKKTSLLVMPNSYRLKTISQFHAFSYRRHRIQFGCFFSTTYNKHRLTNIL